MDYQAYLRSSEWQVKRKLVLDYYGNRCAVCNSPVRVDVHHRRYDNIGSERFTDMITLCEVCHSLFHRMVEPRHVFAQIETLLQGIPR